MPSSEATSRATWQKKSAMKMSGEVPARKSRRCGFAARATSKFNVSMCLDSTCGSLTCGSRWKEMEGLAAATPARKGPVALEPVLFGRSMTTMVTARPRATKILPSSIMETMWPMPGDG
uniref:Uncharacterized protein n=1 Tax=Avena sativa TaxID=4498 RepID=A0ACD5W0M5_AVESA